MCFFAISSVLGHFAVISIALSKDFFCAAGSGIVVTSAFAGVLTLTGVLTFAGVFSLTGVFAGVFSLTGVLALAALATAAALAAPNPFIFGGLGVLAFGKSDGAALVF